LVYFLELEQSIVSTNQEWPRELGRRLRDIRRHAGLTQGQVMELAGRTGRCAKTIASRMESGKMPHVSIQLVADYLRSCRARLSDVADVLDPYTSMLPVSYLKVRAEIEKGLVGAHPDVRAAVLRYNTKTELWRRTGDAKDPQYRRKPITEQEKERVRRALKMARELTIERMANRGIAKVLESYHSEFSITEMRQLGNFGRRVLKALVRHPSGSKQHRRSRRNSLLRAAERVDTDVGMHPAVDEVAETMFGIRNALAESEDLHKLFALDRGERYLRYAAMLERAPKDGDTDKIAARNFEKAMNMWAVTACSLSKLAAYKMLADPEPDDGLERKRVVRMTELLLALVQFQGKKAEKRLRLRGLAGSWYDPRLVRKAYVRMEGLWKKWIERRPVRENTETWQPGFYLGGTGTPGEREREKGKGVAGEYTILLDEEYGSLPPGHPGLSKAP
jgi:transcriptional regulator with XRE-family HTH domain